MPNEMDKSSLWQKTIIVRGQIELPKKGTS